MKSAMTILTAAAMCTCAWAAGVAMGAPQAAGHEPPAFGSEAIAIPQMLSYQGKLTDSLGIPVPNGDYQLAFRLYDLPSGGSPFWSETQSVTTTGGLFSVLLGAATPIGSVPDAGSVYLAMAVSSGAELTPRIRIVSSAFAYLSGRAANADLLQGRDTAAFAAAGHNHDAAYVNEGQAGSVTSVMVMDGAVTAVDFSQMGASSGQVMKWNGSAWAPANDSVGQSSGGTVRRVVQATGVVLSPNPISDSGTVRFDSTWGDARFVNEGQAAGGGLAGAYPSPSIANSVVGSAQIVDGSVTSTDIRDTTVNSAELKDGAVTSAKILDAAVTTADICDTNVTMAKIAQAGATSGQVVKWTGSAWAPGQDNTGGGSGVTSVYEDTGIVCVPNPITSSGNVKLDLPYGDGRYVNEGQANSVTGAMITDGQVSSADIRDTTVNTVDLKDAAVTMTKLNQSGAASGQVIKWTGSTWAPANDSVGGGSGGGTVRKVFQTTGVVVSPNPITDSGTVGFDSAWGDARFVNESQTAGGDLTGTYPNPTLHLPYSGSIDVSGDAFSITNTSPSYNSVGVKVVGGSYGLRGLVSNSNSGNHIGVYGSVSGGSGSNSALSGDAGGGGTTRGVFGWASGTNTKYGLEGHAVGGGTNYGVYGTASDGSTNWAGYFYGDATVTGTLSKGGGSFKIDHPLEPLNKYLYHSFVESPDMMNIYNGNVKTDASGYATITLPDWFEALNRDFRYQVTVIDEEGGEEFAQAKVVRGVKDNSFAIRTSRPFTVVSWQVTGVRHDRFANAHRIQVEVDKTSGERGKYAHPEAYGLPQEAGIGYSPRPDNSDADATGHQR